METFEQQEKRARRKLRPLALVKSALIAALIVFFVPAGPWMSYESGIATMGRVMSTNVFMAALWQVVFALAYGWAIAAIIFSMPTITGIVLGTLVAIPLYALNYLVVGNAMGFAANEVHVGIAHLSFALFFSALYRAMAVPPPHGVAK